MRKTTKLAAAVGASALVIGSAGVAYAFWTTTGSGTGSAGVAASNGTLALHADAVPNITPGTTYNVPIKADNLGTTDLRVNTVHTVITTTTTACQSLITAGTSGLSVADVDTSVTNVAHATNNVVIGAASLVYANSPTIDQTPCQNAPLVLTFSTP
jgi:hypothetical protein